MDWDEEYEILCNAGLSERLRSMILTTMTRGDPECMAVYNYIMIVSWSQLYLMCSHGVSQPIFECPRPYPERHIY